MVERAQPARDRLQRLVPRHRHEPVVCRVVAHRMGQAAGVLQRVVGPAPQLGDGVRGEEVGAGAIDRRLPGHRLGAVLAELERGGVLRIGPGAARAVEAVRLIHGRARVFGLVPISCRTARATAAKAPQPPAGPP